MLYAFCSFGVERKKENSRPTPTFFRNNMYVRIPTCACTARTRFLHRVLFRRTRKIKKRNIRIQGNLFCEIHGSKIDVSSFINSFFFQINPHGFLPVQPKQRIQHRLRFTCLRDSYGLLLLLLLLHTRRTYPSHCGVYLHEVLILIFILGCLLDANSL